MSIFGWKGDGHNLSKGAFDSVSVAKPGTASLLLKEHIGKTFKESYNLLATPYRFNMDVMETTSAASLWREYLRPGLKKAAVVAWEIGKPVAMEVMMGIAGFNPGLAGLVGAAEIVISAYLQGYGDEIHESKSLTFNKGQWLFIETADNRRRRLKGLMKGQKEVKAIVRKRVDIPIVVNFGFYVGPGHEHNKINVFNMDTGKAEHVPVQRIRFAPDNIQSKADGDENLSVLRELYFYKLQGDEFEKTHPKEAIFPGRQVVYKDTDYTLIQRDESSALIEDDRGNTQIVPTSSLTRGVGKSTKGQTDDFFMTGGSGAFYAGQWCMVPARGWVSDRWSTDYELAVVYQVDKNEELEVALCLDGEMVYHQEKDCQVFPPDMQQQYSAKQPFKLFKQAAVKGYQVNTQRFELGSKYAQICTLDYSHTLTYLGSDDKEEMAKYLIKNREIETIGSNTKELVDAVEEGHKKGLTDVQITKVLDETEYSDDPDETLEGEGNDGMLLGLIAVGALILIAVGGAAAA